MAHVYNLNQVAISVPDLDKAIDFYTELFGLHVIGKMDEEQMKHLAPGHSINQMYGPEIKKFKIAFLVTGNSVGFEMFQFVDPPYQGPTEVPPRFGPQEYTRGGFFHVGFPVEDPEAILAKAVKLGARQIGQMTRPTPNLSGTYMYNPWGNVVELISADFQQLFLQMLAKSGG
ncbi:hypothetical protein AYO20_08089 [Fonsecaea nubica]|uniref:VOC domain-containing protein n=1 Tax=Fonsecaea nubica TaxID=856822 RepID=A0A178CQH5_9EURO|nr:hypothetical protein AYO20_08089 [Fonsecaea nubica]OAL31696.1 hypothetical protein AYO20_08089 [Fonsecaea nubica]